MKLINKFLNMKMMDPWLLINSGEVLFAFLSLLITNIFFFKVTPQYWIYKLWGIDVVKTGSTLHKVLSIIVALLVVVYPILKL